MSAGSMEHDNPHVSMGGAVLMIHDNMDLEHGDLLQPPQRRQLAVTYT